MKSWRGDVNIQEKVRIASSEFSHLWADHLAGPSNFSYAQLISTPCLQYIGFIRLGFLKVRVLLKNPFYQISQCKSLNNKLSGWELISVFITYSCGGGTQISGDEEGGGRRGHYPHNNHRNPLIFENLI